VFTTADPATTKGLQMLRGLATVSFFAADLEAAKRWYTELLGIEPYFVGPSPAHRRISSSASATTSTSWA
jgi:hypothetical protein